MSTQPSIFTVTTTYTVEALAAKQGLTMEDLNTLVAENIESCRPGARHPHGQQLGAPSTPSYGYSGTTTLGRRHFRLTQEAHGILAKARREERFVLTEEQLQVLVRGRRVPKLRGLSLSLSEEQVAELIIGRPLSALTDPNITYEAPEPARHLINA